MRKIVISLLLLLTLSVHAQSPLYIQIVSHNEPTDNLQQNLNYAKAKMNALQLATMVDQKGAKWNLQTSDGFTYGARNDQASTGNNIFKMLATSPYDDNIEIDPRYKNFSGRNIADQWYLLDSLGCHPTLTVGGFIYYICQPSSMQPDWWQFQDTITGNIHGNKLQFKILSGAGSAGATLHCNDLYSFGIFKPDTVTNFYSHNANRNLWNVGVGCAPILDSMDNEQAIIDLIQGQVDSIQNNLWPSNKFYVTRIMTNQREYGPLFFSKMSKVLDSLALIPSTKLKWATIGETFTDFENWCTNTNSTHSMWLCGETVNGLKENHLGFDFKIFPNPGNGDFIFNCNDFEDHKLEFFNGQGELIYSDNVKDNQKVEIPNSTNGMYLIKIDGKYSSRYIKSTSN